MTAYKHERYNDLKDYTTQIYVLHYIKVFLTLLPSFLMCLIHDIVEIDAGDTYAYDEEGLKTQKAREAAAKDRIFSILPEDQKEELTKLFDEFEENQTPEAKYAHAMDNLQPLILNNSNDGSDWKEHGVSAGTVYGRQEKTRLGSEKLYEFTDQIIRENIRKSI